MKNAENKKFLCQLVDDNKSELLKICSDLIKIPSVTGSPEIENVLEYEKNFFESLDIPYEVIRNEGVPALIAHIGEKNGKLCIIDGHCDVVTPGNLDKWKFSPYCGTITDTQILGRGTSDMKCGVGIGLFIAKKIKELNLPLNGELRLFIVHDEEAGGEKGSMYLVENGYADNCEYCLIPEPTSGNYIESGQKGSVRMKVTAHGNPVNGSIINYVGSNAVIEMVRFLNDLNLLLELEPKRESYLDEAVRYSKQDAINAFADENAAKAIDKINYSIMSLEGGGSVTMTPEKCEAMVGMLVPIGITMKEMVDKVHEIIRKGNHNNIDIEFVRLKEASFTDPRCDLVRSVCDNATIIKGVDVYPAFQWATSDAKFFRYKNIPTIQYGPSNSHGIHSYNEDVEIKDIVAVAKTYFSVLEDLTGFDELKK